MNSKPFYLIVDKKAVEGALRNYPNNEYIQSVLDGIQNVIDNTPKENLGEVSKKYNLGNHFLDSEENAKRLGSKDREIILCGGFYSNEGSPWDVNTEILDLERHGYTNMEVLEEATLVRETLHK